MLAGLGSAGISFESLAMSEGIGLIVDGYSTLKSRSALEDLRGHRQRLRNQMQNQRNEAGSAVVFDEELRIIEAALASF
jgi:hypothetical protein